MRPPKSVFLLLLCSSSLLNCQKNRGSHPKDVFTVDSNGKVYLYRGNETEVTLRRCPDYALLTEQTPASEVETLCPKATNNEKTFPTAAARQELTELYQRSYLRTYSKSEDPLKREDVVEAGNRAYRNLEKEKEGVLADIRSRTIELAKLQAYFSANKDLVTAAAEAKLNELKKQLAEHETRIAGLSPQNISDQSEVVRAKAWSDALADFMQQNLFNQLFDAKAWQRLASADPQEQRLIEALENLWYIEKTFHVGNAFVASIAVSSDGRWLAAGTQHSFAYQGYDPKTEAHATIVFDVASGQVQHRFANRKYVAAVSFNADSTKLISQCQEGVKIWNMADGSLTGGLGVSGEPHHLRDFAYNPASPYFFTFNTGTKKEQENGLIKAKETVGEWIEIFDAGSGKPVKKLFQPNSDRGDYFNYENADLSPDGLKLLATVGDQVVLIDSFTGKVLRDFGALSYEANLRFSPDGKRIAAVRDTSANKSDIGYIMDTENGHTLASIQSDGASEGQALSVAFSPDGSKIIVGFAAQNSGSAKLFDAKTGKELQSFRGHSWSVTSVGFSPDSRKVYTGSSDGTVKMWHIDSAYLNN